MRITLPDPSLVVLVGTSGSGKSSFARRFFRPTEVLSSDVYRGIVSDDENDQSATDDAFDVLHYVAAKRLGAGRLTVVDATNVQLVARRPLVALARRHRVDVVAIVLDVPLATCRERNRARPDRQFGPAVLARQRRELDRSRAGLGSEGFDDVWVLGVDDVASVEIERRRSGGSRA
jgi:protein phosphatase